MLQRARRSTQRPASYKSFNETGQITEVSNIEQNKLLAEVMEDEAIREPQESQEKPTFNNMQGNGTENLMSLAEHLTPLTPERENTQNTETEMGVDLFVATDDDEFETDTAIEG